MRRSSKPSSTCRFEWRPSAWQAGGLALLAVLASASVLASALPPDLSAWLAVGVLAGGLGQAWREWRRAPFAIVWGGDCLSLVDARGRVRHLFAPRLHEQGPLLCLAARDGAGRRWRAAWWPDTLPGPVRRQLRLHARVSHRPDNPLPSVAA